MRSRSRLLWEQTNELCCIYELFGQSCGTVTSSSGLKGGGGRVEVTLADWLFTPAVLVGNGAP
eukprot:COSAG03_NODE_1364_length_4251_cov_4.775771_6_plen_63_part_00